jgi:hypothetical protein
VVNSGNANAFTGKSGRQACALTAKLAATASRIEPSSDLRFIRPWSFNPSALVSSSQRLIKTDPVACGDRYRAATIACLSVQYLAAITDRWLRYDPRPYSAIIKLDRQAIQNGLTASTPETWRRIPISFRDQSLNSES